MYILNQEVRKRRIFEVVKKIFFMPKLMSGTDDRSWMMMRVMIAIWRIYPLLEWLEDDYETRHDLPWCHWKRELVVHTCSNYFLTVTNPELPSEVINNDICPPTLLTYMWP